MRPALLELQNRPTPEMGQPDILGIGKTVVDQRVRFPQGASEALLPLRIQRVPFDKKEAAHDLVDFRDVRKHLIRNGARITRDNGGNIFNVLKAMHELTGEEYAINTWVGTDGNGRYIRKQIELAGLTHINHDHPYVGDSATSLVIPRVTPDGPDKTNFGYMPIGFPSEFPDFTKIHPRLTLVNSTTGEEWPDNLSRGTISLDREGLLRTYTPGSSQFEAVELGTDAAPAVYGAVQGAHLVPVNASELGILLQGKGVEPASKPKELLKQGLGTLGPEILLVTFGSHGAIAAVQDGEMLQVSATRVNRVRSTNKAGDRFQAAFLAQLIGPNGNLEDALLEGSAYASLGVEGLPLGRKAVEKRRVERPADLDALAA